MAATCAVVSASPDVGKLMAAAADAANAAEFNATPADCRPLSNASSSASSVCSEALSLSSSSSSSSDSTGPRLTADLPVVKLSTSVGNTDINSTTVIKRGGQDAVQRADRQQQQQQKSKAASVSGSGASCRWTGCVAVDMTSAQLHDHLKSVHVGSTSAVNSSSESGGFHCLWTGCRVYGKTVRSRSWLEKHVMHRHTGAKPFACIVTDCHAAFGTKIQLERHVNSHFEAQKATPPPLPPPPPQSLTASAASSIASSYVNHYGDSSNAVAIMSRISGLELHKSTATRHQSQQRQRRRRGANGHAVAAVAAGGGLVASWSAPAQDGRTLARLYSMPAHVFDPFDAPTMACIVDRLERQTVIEAGDKYGERLSNFRRRVVAMRRETTTAERAYLISRAGEASWASSADLMATDLPPDHKRKRGRRKG